MWSVKIGITLQQEIKKPRKINWNSKNIAGFAGSICRIKKLNRDHRPVALMAERRTPNPMDGGSSPSRPAASI